MIALENKILQRINLHKSGKSVGIKSVCSANHYVIKAAILNAKKNNQILLIEATSNQVDQFGGYTKLTPAQFKQSVLELAKQLNFSEENIILGGDHLGPNRWQNESSAAAMHKAEDQISAYVSAGFIKIHLDASMKCADDGDRNLPLDPSNIAERCATLCRASEEALTQSGHNDLPVYIIGTDVPPPGGVKDHHNIHITKPEEVEETISLTERAFKKYNLNQAWERVIGVVVQPGVEFGDSEVFDYDRNKCKPLVKLIENYPILVYEAHSTDYQKKELLRQMVEDHFVFVKVGPWLTYAFREAVFALATIEMEMLSNKKGILLSNLIDIVDQRMLEFPKYWENYYTSTEEENKLKRKFSYSDRVRYYWSDKKVEESLQRLIKNLNENKIPITLLSQYLPEEFNAIREGMISANPEEIILHKISSVLEIYNYATSGGVN
jgi:D-tagatose-1,6-bisphosphate aldolase subunit GatZ/KbaZ